MFSSARRRGTFAALAGCVLVASASVAAQPALFEASETLPTTQPDSTDLTFGRTTTTTKPLPGPTLPCPVPTESTMSVTSPSGCPSTTTSTTTELPNPIPIPTPSDMCTASPVVSDSAAGSRRTQPGSLGDGDAGPAADDDNKGHEPDIAPDPDPARTAVRAVADAITERVGLEADLSGVAYPEYAGVVIEPSARRTWLYWKGPLPDTIAAFVGELRSRHPDVEIVVMHARYSMLELHAARDRLVERIDSGRSFSVFAHTFVVPPEGTCLTVEISPVDGEDPVQLAARAKAELESATGGVLVQVLLDSPTQRTAGRQPHRGRGAGAATRSGRWSDTERYYAGIRLITTTVDAGTEYDSFCSSGFAVTKAKKDHLLAAAHCFEVGFTPEVRNGANFGLGRKIGEVDTNFVVRDRDAALVQVPSSLHKAYSGGIDDPAKPFAASTEKVVTFADYERHPPYKEKDGTIAGAPVGDTWISGASTGGHGGLVVSDANVVWYFTAPGAGKDAYDGLAIGPGFELEDPAGGVITGLGDSGGPVYFHNKNKDWIALGIISGSDTEAPCGDYPKDFDPYKMAIKCFKQVSVVPVSSLLKATGSTFKPVR